MPSVLPTISEITTRISMIGKLTRSPVMIWGKQDPHIPREGRRLIYDTMTDKGVTFTWHEFNGQHAFMRDEGHRYDPALALKCYGLVLELFKRKLGEGDLPAQEGGAKESKH